MRENAGLTKRPPGSIIYMFKNSSGQIIEKMEKKLIGTTP